jgi:hypothetical protein
MRTLLLLTAFCLTFNTNIVSAAHLAVSHNASPRRPFTALAFTHQIQHHWRQVEADYRLRWTDVSLGTRIAPDLILTHNHFPEAPALATEQSMTFFAASGRGAEPDFDAVRLQPFDDGTQLIHLPPAAEAVPADCARLADRETIAGLGFGAWLTVVYWDEPNSSLVQAEFFVLAADGRTATLFDPFAQINPGDSGGGVFRDGKLVGNTWSILTLNDNTPLRLFKVALLPESLLMSRSN